MNDTMLAFIVVYGYFDEDWIHCLVDEVEWTQPRYYHQN